MTAFYKIHKASSTGWNTHQVDLCQDCFNIIEQDRERYLPSLIVDQDVDYSYPIVLEDHHVKLA